jgi:hypothetical protein
VTVVPGGIVPAPLEAKVDPDPVTQEIVAELVLRHMLYVNVREYPDPDSVVLVPIGPCMGAIVSVAVVTVKGSQALVAPALLESPEYTASQL